MLNDTVKCEVCGKYFRVITRSHLKTHGITTFEYMGMFPDVKTHSDKLLEHLREIAIVGGNKPPNLSSEERSKARKGKKLRFVGNHLELKNKKVSEALSNSVKVKENAELMKTQRLGEGNPNWKGGCKPAVFTIPFPKQEKIKKRIRKRDNYKCCVCGELAYCVHHIDHDQSNWDDSNLITMCNKHHSATNHNKSIEQVTIEYKNKV